VLENGVADASKSVASAKKHIEEAKLRAGETRTSHEKERSIANEIGPKLDGLRARVTVELRPEVDALTEQLGVLSAQSSTTAALIADTSTKISESDAELLATSIVLASSQKAAEEIRTKLGPDYEQKVASITETANATELAYADTSKKLMWYRAHWWGAWLVIAIGISGCVAFYVLKIAAR
jgi:chromosome segregation ATPase